MKLKPYVIQESNYGPSNIERDDAARKIRQWRREMRRVHTEKLENRICYTHGPMTICVPL